MNVAIVNDLAIATEALRRVLLSIPGVTVVWTAVNGAEAVEKCRAKCPDLILMDMIMPVMDGVEATRRIMHESPCAIVVVTATVEGNANRVFEALSAGALDATNTPATGPAFEAAREELIRKIEIVKRLRASHAPAGRVESGAGATPWAATPTTSGAAHVTGSHASTSRAVPHAAALSAPPCPGAARWMSRLPPIAAIGSSTGGPQALATILSGLPMNFPFAMIVVQHLDLTFTPGLAQWLARETGRQVQLAEGGREPRAGVCSIAATRDQFILDHCGTFAIRQEPRDTVHRPSIDLFFRSLLSSSVKKGAAVILTGMGRDGAAALGELRREGWHTIAQDKATSVVWGMPGAASQSGAATITLPLGAIADELMRTVGAPVRHGG